MHGSSGWKLIGMAPAKMCAPLLMVGVAVCHSWWLALSALHALPSRVWREQTTGSASSTAHFEAATLYDIIMPTWGSFVVSAHGFCFPQVLSLCFGDEWNTRGRNTVRGCLQIGLGWRANNSANGAKKKNYCSQRCHRFFRTTKQIRSTHMITDRMCG